MEQQNLYENVLLDQITIPCRLLTEYQKHNIDEQELIIILQIHRFSTQGVYFPTPDELSAAVTFDHQQCSTILRKLLQKDVLKIIENHDSQSRVNERYSLEPLWTKLFEQKKNDEAAVNEHVINIFLLFEQEFGRTLSPFEIETINIWLDEDEQDPALIKAALREAVLMSKLNFKYIDRILREWKRKGIRSVEQAREHSRAFHNRTNDSETKQNRDQSIYYNWLDEDE